MTIVWHANQISLADRTAVTRTRGAIVWLTGLSGCGKSTIAMALECALIAGGYAAYVLDGDNIRHGLNKGLSFSPEDRTENIRRIGEVSKLFADAGLIAITSFISPYRADRDRVRSIVQEGLFYEIFVDAPLSVCECRDPKGLYAKARRAIAEGQSPQFTGLDAPYESPARPELHLHSDTEPTAESVAKIIALLKQHNRLI